MFFKVEAKTASHLGVFALRLTLIVANVVRDETTLAGLKTAAIKFDKRRGGLRSHKL